MTYHTGPEVSAEALTHASMEQVNQERLRMGLARLTPDPVLSRVALAHSMDMARRRFYGHMNPDRLGPAERIEAAGYDALASAENIARGYRDPNLVVNGWMDSPGHRANILNPDFQTIGAGYFVDTAAPDGHYWTHLFAVPDRAGARDHTAYSQELLALLNQERAAAGYAPLSAPPALQTSIAQTTARLAAQGADGFSQGTGETVRRIAETAHYTYRQIIAHFVCGRQAGLPEGAFDQLMDGGLSRDLLNRAYIHAAIGYHLVREDPHRHYWFLLLAAPQG
jgi:uncharacterized protein YkwD